MLPRRRLAGAAALVGLFALLVLPVPAASAATPGGHGYWWRLQTGTGPALPPPPFVPPGGLWVANEQSGQQNDNSGQLAVSAIRYRAPTGVEIRRLDLKVARSSGDGALMLACSARTSWKPVEAGEWDKQPGTRCDVAFVRGVPSANGDTWSFDVRGLGRSGTLDVVILPPPGLQATFSISFEAPGPSSIVTQRLPGSPSPSTSRTPEETPRAGRVSPSPTRVLGQKTTTPGSPPTALTRPSSGSPSAFGAPQASGPAAETPHKRKVWLFGIAATLALAVFVGRAVLTKR